MILTGRILFADAAREGWIHVEGDRIVGSGTGEPPGAPDYEAELISPGLWDLQVNGCGGTEVTDGLDALDRIARDLVAQGVTSFLPTIVTTSDEVASRAVVDVEVHMHLADSPIVGVHLEGPFLSPSFRGVHRKQFLRTPDLGVPLYYLNESVRMVTLAPELPGAMDLIRRLTSRGVTVSIGHTGCTALEAEMAAEAGARMVTHLFNGMPRFHHRDPGLVGWALTSRQARLGVIADLSHVAGPTLAIVNEAAGDRVILVTDLAVGAFVKDVHSWQAGVELFTDEDGRVRTLAGHLAGGDCSLAQMVHRWASATGLDFALALLSVTWRPAQILGRFSLLSAGDPADLIAWCGHEIDRILHRGQWIQPRDTNSK